MNDRSTTNRRRLVRRVTLGGGVAVLVLVLAVLAAGTYGKMRLRSEFPPPGQRVDVGGYDMHLYCTGNGSGSADGYARTGTETSADAVHPVTAALAPTIILDAGGNDFSIFWGPVQRALSEDYFVCAYDRAGLGWSDANGEPRTATVMVEELRQLLNAAGVAGPFVLVGHSLGGVHMRLFARLYPEDVIGLVLVDSAHESQIAEIPVFRPAIEAADKQFGNLSTLTALGLLALTPDKIPSRGLPPEEAAQYRAVLASRPHFRGMQTETAHMEKSLSQAIAAATTELGDMPLVVLSRGRAEPLIPMSEVELIRFEEAWRQYQIDLASLSTRSHHVIAETSGHYIHLDQPELVVDAVRQVLSYY